MEVELLTNKPLNRPEAYCNVQTHTIIMQFNVLQISIWNIRSCRLLDLA